MTFAVYPSSRTSGSSLRLTDSIAIFAACVVAGACMKIYPDPELPDLEVEWFGEECSEDTPTVRVTVAGTDNATRVEQLVPCTDSKYTFRDLPRERYLVDGALLFEDGTTFATADAYEVDLRNGFDERAYLYLAASAYLRLAWAFDMGASCASLGADTVEIAFLANGYFVDTLCEDMVYTGYPPGRTDRVQLRALAQGVSVAISPESPPFTLMPPALTDLGTLTLTPCGGTCPE